MNDSNLNSILIILKNAINDNKYNDDIVLIKNLYNTLSNLKEKDITINDLEIIRNNINFLEDKYYNYLGLLYYFEPLSISIKHNIHASEIKKIREENKIRKEKRIDGKF